MARYLANQLLLTRDPNNPSYDNSKNGLRARLRSRLAEFLRDDFIEYNSHNYQDFTMTALLNLASLLLRAP